MFQLLNKIKKSDDGVSVLELLLYIVVAAALVLAAWFGLSSLMNSGNQSSVEQGLASAYKISKAACVYQADWNTCKIDADWDVSVTAANAGQATIQAALTSEGSSVIANINVAQELELTNTVGSYSDTMVLANYYSPPFD